MKELIAKLQEKAQACGYKTKEDRARKGAYVDCVVMIKSFNNCSNCGEELRPECIEDGDNICVDCFNEL